MLFKKGVIILSILVFTLFSVAADLNTQVLTPDDIDWTGSHSLYELTSKVVRIDFLKSNQSQLNQVNVTLTGATVNNIVQGATCSISGSLVTCGDIDILRLNITASNVAATTNFDWDVRAIDSQSGLINKTLQLEVVNDALAPRYTLNSPSAYALVKNSSTLFNITPLEAESGFNSARILYDYYPAIGSSSVLGESSLTCGTFCTTSVTLTPSVGNYYFGYFFNLTDKAGNENITSTQWVYVDVFAPIVAATTPADNVTINVNSYNYGFTVQENSFGIDALFTPQVVCSLYIDSTLKNTTTLTANATVTLASSLSGLADGSHTWYSTCVDTAGWSSSTATRTFVLDTMGPAITLSSPANGSVINTTQFVSLSVSDALSSVSEVWYTDQSGVNQTISSPYSISSASWLEGTFLLRVYANDSLNNPSSTAFTFIVDSTAPAITFLSPANTTYNSTGIFRVRATDGNGGNIGCTLIVDGAQTGSSQSAVSGSTYSFTNALADGTHTWGSNCVDQVGNAVSVESMEVLVDTVAPAISLIAPTNGTNLAGAADFLFVVTELNAGTGTCSLLVNGTTVASTVGYANVTGFTLNPSNDIQSWNVTCWDAANNAGTSATQQVYYDTLVPVISGLSNTAPTTTSVVVSWLVNEQTTNTLFYGTNNASLSSSLAAGSVNSSPNIELTSLTSSTLYYYIAQSCDQWNLCTNSSLKPFTTDTTPAPGPSPGSGGGGGGSSKTQCNDGKDNDKDGFVDGNDVGCESTSDDDESNSAKVKESSGSCQENWKCTEWSECSNGAQTRTCEDENVCGTQFIKPDESKGCNEEIVNLASEVTETVPEEEVSTGNVITGAVTGVINKVKSNGTLVAGLISLAAIGGLAIWKREFFGSKMLSKGLKASQSEEQIQEQLRKGGIIK